MAPPKETPLGTRSKPQADQRRILALVRLHATRLEFLGLLLFGPAKASAFPQKGWFHCGVQDLWIVFGANLHGGNEHSFPRESRSGYPHRVAFSRSAGLSELRFCRVRCPERTQECS